MCKKMKILLFLSILFSWSVNAEESICPKVKSKGEGHWPIPESSFTKEAAKSALEKLDKYISEGTYGMDTVMIDNNFISLKGYLLKSRVETDMPFVKEDVILLF